MPSLDYNNSVIIYKIKNLINGKIYIGQTKSTTKKRFSQHCEKRNKTVIGLAIKKYGRGSFRVSVLREGVETKTELDALEIAYIASCGSIAPSGYNVEEGGQASTMSKEIKQKIRLKLKGREVTWKAKISKTVTELWEDKEYRKTQTEQRHGPRGRYRDGIKKPLRLNLSIKTINEMHATGDSIYKIAKHFKVSFCTIKRRIKNVE